MKDPKQIEEMADAYKPNFQHEECLDRDDLEFIENEEGEQFVSLDEVDRVAKSCHHYTFQKAYSLAQNDIIESTSEGFQEWWNSLSPQTQVTYTAFGMGEKAWTASRLGMMKELQVSEKREGELKDRLIDQLKLQNEIKQLKQELRQQRFNNKHNLSIDQKVADEIKQMEETIKQLKEVLEMVMDNSKMPHKHTDPQERLYCLAERAREVLDKEKA